MLILKKKSLTIYFYPKKKKKIQRIRNLQCFYFYPTKKKIKHRMYFLFFSNYTPLKKIKLHLQILVNSDTKMKMNLGLWRKVWI